LGFFDTGPSASYRRVLVFALGLGLTAALAFSSVASAGQTSTGSTAAAATATTIYRPYYSVEVYYLKLMNCTRTGGWVTSTGGCSSPGGRNVAPLKLDSGILPSRTGAATTRTAIPAIACAAPGWPTRPMARISAAGT